MRGLRITNYIKKKSKKAVLEMRGLEIAEYEWEVYESRILTVDNRKKMRYKTQWKIPDKWEIPIWMRGL